jgi:outer membrane protein TolC
MSFGPIPATAFLALLASSTGISSMSLPQALEYALAHQPSLRAAKARAQAALAEAAVPRAKWFPQLGASAQLIVGSVNNTSAMYDAPAVMDVPRIGGAPAVLSSTASWRPYASTFVGVGLRQELFDFGKIAAASAVFDAAAQAQGYRAQASRLDLELGVKESYFAVLAAKAILEASRSAATRAKEERDYAAAGVRSGLRSPIDLTRAQAELLRLDAARIRSEGGLTAAQGVFAAVVGFPEALLDAVGEGTSAASLPPMASGLRQAQEHDPAILAYDAELQAQEAQTHAALMGLFPDLTLTSTLSARAGGAPLSNGQSSSGYNPDVPNWDVGVLLSWQLFDEGVLARRRVFEHLEEARRQELDAAKLNAGAAVEQAYAAVDVALRALPALQDSVQAARANLAQADARFRAGLGTSLELADAEAVQVDADIQLALGRFEYDRARARAARALGESQ